MVAATVAGAIKTVDVKWIVVDVVVAAYAVKVETLVRLHLRLNLLCRRRDNISQPPSSATTTDEAGAEAVLDTVLVMTIVRHLSASIVRLRNRQRRRGQILISVNEDATAMTTTRRRKTEDTNASARVAIKVSDTIEIEITIDVRELGFAIICTSFTSFTTVLLITITCIIVH